MMSGIYIIKNLVNGKVYVGKSIDIRRRKSVHLQRLRKGLHHNIHLQNAFNEYGESNFVFEVIEKCEREKLAYREKCWIVKYDAMNKSKGYNLTEGGDGLGSIVTKETRQKMSNAARNRTPDHLEKLAEARKGKSSWNSGKTGLQTAWNKGRTLDDAYKDRLSDSHKGIMHSEETRRKMSDSHKGKNTWMIGIKLSEETKQKMRESQQRRYETMTQEQAEARAKKKISESHRKRVDQSGLISK